MISDSNVKEFWLIGIETACRIMLEAEHSRVDFLVLLEKKIGKKDFSALINRIESSKCTVVG